jgi:hypothetical protein
MNSTLNSAFIWVVTLCSSEKVRRFSGTYRLNFLSQRPSQARAPLASCLLLASCSAYISSLKMEAIVSPKHQISSDIESVTTRRNALFIATAVST